MDDDPSIAAVMTKALDDPLRRRIVDRVYKPFVVGDPLQRFAAPPMR